jgi:branched-subunit amino acid ABC-type transport system permease component
MDVEKIDTDVRRRFRGGCDRRALLAPAAAITPTMGRVPLILSLIVVIASGMENVWNLFFLAIGLGVLSNVSAYLLAPGGSYVLLLGIVVLLLVARPSGLSFAAPGRDD